MKKTLLGFCAVVGVLASSAGVTGPRFFESDFKDQFFKNNHRFPEGYTTYGVEGTIDSFAAQYFPAYTPSTAFSFLSWSDSDVAACTPFGFTDNGVAVSPDQWLITPEFTVTEDKAMFCYSIMQSGASGLQKFSLYISETGTAKEDFTKVYDGSVAGSASGIFTGSRRFVLDGYKGKTVRMALVAHSGKAGLIGFYDIVGCQYLLNVTNAADLEAVVLGENYDNTSIGVAYSFSTPVEVKGFKAVLRTEKGFETTYSSNGTLNSNKLTSSRFVFPTKVDMQGETEQAYTITITPNDETMAPTVISGKLYRIDPKYDSSALIEEITGSWCGWCPRGIAFMSYYKDKYNSLGKGKVIPVMLHYGDMMDCSASYFESVYSRMGKYLQSLGFPMCMVNRSSAGDPGEVNVDATMASLSYGHLNILEAGFDGGNRNRLRVRTGNMLNFSSSSVPVRTALVLIENDVMGDNDDWNQLDYYGSYGESAIQQSYGAEMVPYFREFVNVSTVDPGSNYPCIPYTTMKYPEVARNVAPSFAGELLEGAWVADEVKSHDLLIDIPATVDVLENCAVVAMLLGPDGSVIGSDILDYEDWADRLDGLGVDGVSADSLKLNAMAVADGLGIKINEKAQISVWSVDGTNLFAGSLQPGEHILNVAKGRTVIVKAEGAGKTAVAKVIL